MNRKEWKRKLESFGANLVKESDDAVWGTFIFDDTSYLEICVHFRKKEEGEIETRLYVSYQGKKNNPTEFWETFDINNVEIQVGVSEIKITEIIPALDAVICNNKPCFLGVLDLKTELKVDFALKEIRVVRYIKDKLFSIQKIPFSKKEMEV